MNKPKCTPSTTICWNCQNAVPNASKTRGCNWSIKGEPVEGWEAVERDYYPGFYSGETKKSYTVKSCPLFLRDNIL